MHACAFIYAWNISRRHVRHLKAQANLFPDLFIEGFKSPNFDNTAAISMQKKQAREPIL